MVALAVAGGVRAARPAPLAQVSALAAALTIAVQLPALHWFYFYIVWFMPFVLVAVLAGDPGARARPSVRRRERSEADPDVEPDATADRIGAGLESPMPPVVAVRSAAIGAAVGSFLNVVVYRLPRGESLVHPASHCPGCEHADPALRQRARPRLAAGCAAAAALAASQISPRYPVVEAVTRRAGGRGRAHPSTRRATRARAGAGRGARSGRADRLRPPDHPQQDHAPGRDRRLVIGAVTEPGLPARRS